MTDPLGAPSLPPPAALSMTDASERDVKRFDELTQSFERTAVLLGFANLFVALWARAPGLQINFGSLAGLPTVGLNVGYAIVYGPLLALMTVAVHASLLFRRDTVLAGIRATIATAKPAALLSPGEMALLDGFVRARARDRIGYRADRIWRTIWYFVIPPLAGLICFIRFFDFVPDLASKGWHPAERIAFLLFSRGGWEIRPVLPEATLDADDKLMAALPYIYAPLQAWLTLAVVILTLWLAVHAWRQYFRTE